jgi:acyl-CoA synthetase (AMP-forming)/AMP-acid ligase II
VKALVVLKPCKSADEPELIAHCYSPLAHFKYPTSVEFREEFTRTSIGKLQEFKIRAQYRERKNEAGQLMNVSHNRQSRRRSDAATANRCSHANHR